MLLPLIASAFLRSKLAARMPPEPAAMDGCATTSPSAALLVLLPATARTRIVPANFGTCANRFRFLDSRSGFADDVAGLPRALRLPLRIRTARAAAECAARLMHRPLRHVLQKILKRHQRRRAAEDVVANLGFDVDHQLVKD